MARFRSVAMADVLRVGDPDRAADDPSVPLVQFRVIGVARAARLDGAEDGALKFPAQVPQHVLGQVGGLVADLPERLRPGQRARGGDSEDEHERVAASPGLARVRDQGQHRQQAGNLPGPVVDHAGHGGNSGMRHWTGGLSFRFGKA
jgi:hypothetical protein